MLVHCHKTLADIIDPVAIAKMFASVSERRKEHACWKVQVNVDSRGERGCLLLLIEAGGGGGGRKKNGMSNFIFSRSYTKYSSDLNLGKSLCICRLFTPGFRFLLNLIK